MQTRNIPSAKTCGLMVALIGMMMAPMAMGQQSNRSDSDSDTMQPMQPVKNAPGSESAPQQVINLNDPPPVPSSQSPNQGQVDDDAEPTGVRAEDILRQFQMERPKPVPILPGRSDSSGAVVDDGSGDGQGAIQSMPDGYFVVDRVGRLVQEGEWWVIHFIADNNPTKAPQPPMKLLPNRMLERMIHESRISAQHEYIVSGEVTEFAGENFLLLRKLMRRRSLGNLSR